jgi:putative transposase
MARKLRITFVGAIYHVTVRGNARQETFVDDRDRERFLRGLSEQAEKHSIRLYLYCLMPNHVHLVFETPKANISRFMQSLITGYTVYFNKRHSRVGHLFQGRFGAKLVQGDEYLLKLTRYVHLNPVHRDGVRGRSLRERCEYLRQYPWSSYRSYVGKSRAIDGLETGAVLALLAVRGRRSQGAYGRFVETGLAESDEQFRSLLKGEGDCVGGDVFRDRVRDVAEGRLRSLKRPEDVAFRQKGVVLRPQTILRVIAGATGVGLQLLTARRRGDGIRSIVAKMLSQYGGLSNREIAAVLGLKWGSAVSWQIRQADLGLLRDKGLRQQVAGITKALDAAGR